MSLGTFGVVGFVRVRPGGSLGLLGAVWFVPVRTGGSWVHTGCLGSFGYNFGVVWLIRGLCNHSGASFSLLGYFVVVGFIRVHPGSFDVIGFIWVCPGCRVFIQGRCVRSGAPCGSLGSFGCALGAITLILGSW